MRRPVIWSLAAIVLLAAAAVGYVLFNRNVTNPRVEQALREDPHGEIADQVMLLTFADGYAIPVNYLREGSTVYVGADGRWWRRLRAGDVPVEVLIHGETLAGRASAITDDPARTAEVFSKLRPTVPPWLPDWLNGVLIVIELDAPEATNP